MKKSLIALAVLTAAGAVSAQVSVTGKFGAGYTSTSTNNAGNNGSDSANGFGVTDGNVTFAATEDLGGGLKAAVSMDVRVRGRAASPTLVAPSAGGASTSVDGRDATVSLSGGFGSITLGAVELGNGIIGLGGADAPTQGLDGASSPLSGVSLQDVVNADIFAYTSPEFAGGFTAKVVLVDSLGAPGANGMQDAATTQDGTLIGVDYANGPLAVSADYTNFGFNNNAMAPAVTALTLLDKRTRISASYDLGVAKLGVGYEALTTQTVAVGNTLANPTTAVDHKEYILGVSAPLGSNLVAGANYTRHTNNAVGNTTITGWDLGVQYNLSKRTNVQIGYRVVDEDTAANDNKSTRIRLLHSF